jgi:co-chaperonin GroES (HSP10)
MSRYEPKFGRVLIERELKEKSAGGIILPDNKKHAACIGKVVALGETAGWTETYDDQHDRIVVQTLKVNDKVIFGRHSGAWLDATYDARGGENDDGKLFICQDQDILAVVKEQA